MEKSNKVLVVLVILLAALCVFLGYQFFKIKNTNNTNNTADNKEKCEKTVEHISSGSGEYCILSNKRFNQFDKLDFTNKTTATSDYGKVYVKDGKLHHVYEGKDTVIKTKKSNIVSVSFENHCGAPTGIAYLTSDNELYYFVMAQGDIANLGNEHLLATDAVGITKFEIGKVEFTTCGGYYTLYKNTEGKVYSVSVDDNYDYFTKINVEKMRYKYIGGSEYYVYLMDNEDAYPDGCTHLYNDEGIITAVKAFKFLEEEYDKEEEESYTEAYVLVIDPKNREYIIKDSYIEGYELKSTGKIVKDIKKEGEDKYTFTYSDNTKKTYEAEQVY